MDIERVLECLDTRYVGRPLRYLPSTGSTMDDARDLAMAGAPSGASVVAGEQTAGRGRLGRSWVAPAGVNLSVSIMLRPTREQLARLALVAPLAVRDAIAAVGGPDPMFKWPNDVLVQGRKIAGILIEGAFAGDEAAHAIMGIGLNVNLDTAAYPEIAAIATSIAREVGHLVPIEDTLAALLNAVERWIEEDGEEARRAWRDRLETLGRDVTVTFLGRSERGVAEDVDHTGALLLRRRDGSLVRLPAGEVTLRPPATEQG